MELKTYTVSGLINYKTLDTTIATGNYVNNYQGFTATETSITFYGDSFSDELGLDSLIANYVYAPTPVFKLTGLINPPYDIDYDLYGLHKKKTLVTGELQLIEYFRNYDGITYSDLVVKEERAYTRNVYGLVEYRDQVSTWYLEDDTVGCVKPYLTDGNGDIIPLRKYYNSQESMEEAEYRRSNLLSDAKLYTASQVGLANALDLMTSVNAEISLYVQGEQTALINALNASVKPYMTQEIKDTLTVILTLND
jgi:hypothetical protein